MLRILVVATGSIMEKGSFYLFIEHLQTVVSTSQISLSTLLLGAASTPPTIRETLLLRTSPNESQH